MIVCAHITLYESIYIYHRKPEYCKMVAVDAAVAANFRYNELFKSKERRIK